MDETARQIEAHIERTRARLGSDLRELSTRVDAATDWREHVRQRPYLWMGAALVGGVALAQVVGSPPRPTRALGAATNDATRRPRAHVRGDAFELWDTLTTAMMGLAATRLKGYVSDLIPGFSDELKRAESRRQSSRRDGWADTVTTQPPAMAHDR